MYALLADLVVVVHFAFIAFAVGGGLLGLRWPRLAWLHLPAVAWAGLISLFAWTCPLTPLEDRLRVLAGEDSYSGDFVTRHVLPLIYPTELTREIQVLLGVGVVGLNLAVYCWLWWRCRR